MDQIAYAPAPSETAKLDQLLLAEGADLQPLLARMLGHASPMENADLLSAGLTLDPRQRRSRMKEQQPQADGHSQGDGSQAPLGLDLSQLMILQQRLQAQILFQQQLQIQNNQTQLLHRRRFEALGSAGGRSSRVGGVSGDPKAKGRS